MRKKRTDGGGKRSLDPTNYICPRCGGLIPNNRQWGQYPGAVSRFPMEENGVEYVCSDCGVEEAIVQFMGETEAVDVYPILTDAAIRRRFDAIVIMNRAEEILRDGVRRQPRRIHPTDGRG